MLIPRPLILAALLALPCGAQTVYDRFRESYPLWEKQLEKGDATAVRKAAEAVIQKEGAVVNPSDYNEMRALVGAMDVAARACVLQGDWENAVQYLQKASGAAADNLAHAEATFGKVRKDHEQKLQEWTAAMEPMEKRLKAMDEQPGLSDVQMKARTQLRASVAEYQAAVERSRQALKEIDGLLDQLRTIRASYDKSLEEWRTFLERERLDIAQAGSPARYVAEKLPQVRADETKPRFDRLAYARRLKRLDPANPACAEFLGSLVGSDEPVPTPKAEAPVKRKRKATRRS
nr:hypothetical protein [uncultured Holophaga sp.]